MFGVDKSFLCKRFSCLHIFTSHQRCCSYHAIFSGSEIKVHFSNTLLCDAIYLIFTEFIQQKHTCDKKNYVTTEDCYKQFDVFKIQCNVKKGLQGRSLNVAHFNRNMFANANVYEAKTSNTRAFAQRLHLNVFFLFTPFIYSASYHFYLFIYTIAC